MTKQEALYELKNNLNVDYGRRSERQIKRLDEAITMAIRALEEQDQQCIPLDFIHEYCKQCNTNKYELPFSDEALADKQYTKDIDARATIARLIMAYQEK